MAVKVGINGFGRIGRNVLKILKERYPNELDVVAFNDLGNLQTMAHLFKYDTVYGRYEDVEVREDGLVVAGDFVQAFSESDPAKLPWGDLGVDIVIGSTGVFKQRAQAAKHLEAGAKKVIISAPSRTRTSPLCSASTRTLTAPTSTTSFRTQAARRTRLLRRRRSSTSASAS